MKNFQAHQALRDISRYVFKCISSIVVRSCARCMHFTRTPVYVYFYGGFALVKPRRNVLFNFDSTIWRRRRSSQRHELSRDSSSLRRIYKKILKFVNRAQKAFTISLPVCIYYFLFLYEKIYWTQNWGASAGHGRSRARFCVTLSVIYIVKSRVTRLTASISQYILQSSLSWLEIKFGRAYIFCN